MRTAIFHHAMCLLIGTTVGSCAGLLFFFFILKPFILEPFVRPLLRQKTQIESRQEASVTCSPTTEKESQ